jgi:hypothetical protein
MASDKPETLPRKNLPVLVLLFDALPVIQADVLRREISAISPDSTSADLMVSEATGLYGNVQLGAHRIKLIGIQAPYPDLSSLLQPAHLRPDQKQTLADHKTHVICYYEGTSGSGVEQFIALYTLAYGLRKLNMRGLANPQTWMCQTSDMLPDMLTPEFLQSFRDSPASSMMLWLGFVKFFKPNNTIWFATKGSPFFGVPDLAYLGKDLTETDDALDMFANIFTYIFKSGAQVAPGHTVQLGHDVYLRFNQVTEYADYLGEDTLVIEKIRASDINRRA